MAKKKKSEVELKDRSIDELKAELKEVDRKLFLMRNELSTQRKLEKPHLLKEMRKNKARILTVVTQKQKGYA